jgi:hypothetical protein
MESYLNEDLIGEEVAWGLSDGDTFELRFDDEEFTQCTVIAESEHVFETSETGELIAETESEWTLAIYAQILSQDEMSVEFDVYVLKYTDDELVNLGQPDEISVPE